MLAVKNKHCRALGTGWVFQVFVFSNMPSVPRVSKTKLPQLLLPHSYVRCKYLFIHKSSCTWSICVLIVANRGCLGREYQNQRKMQWLASTRTFQKHLATYSLSNVEVPCLVRYVSHYRIFMPSCSLLHAQQLRGNATKMQLSSSGFSSGTTSDNLLN